jgi:hypothetical protein
VIAPVEECSVCFAAAPWRAVLEVAIPIDDSCIGIRRLYLPFCYCDVHKGWLTLRDLVSFLPLHVMLPARAAFASVNGRAEVRFVEAWAAAEPDEVIDETGR